MIPVFNEVTPPSLPAVAEVESIEDHLSYVRDPKAEERLETLIEEMRQWDEHRIVVEPRKYWISARYSGKVFAYLKVRRSTFVVETYDPEDNWPVFPIKDDDDLKKVRPMLQACVEEFK